MSNDIMKFVLIYTVCSFLSGECLPEITSTKIYDDWNQCTQAGLVAIKESIALFPEDYINDNHLGGRYICREVNSI